MAELPFERYLEQARVDLAAEAVATTHAALNQQSEAARQQQALTSARHNSEVLTEEIGLVVVALDEVGAAPDSYRGKGLIKHQGWELGKLSLIHNVYGGETSTYSPEALLARNRKIYYRGAAGSLYHLPQDKWFYNGQEERIRYGLARIVTRYGLKV